MIFANFVFVHGIDIRLALSIYKHNKDHGLFNITSLCHIYGY